MRTKRLSILPALALLCALMLPAAARAEDQVYYLGTTVNAGEGYAKSDDVSAKDPHYGWSIGRFYLTGFTNVQREGDAVTFLKTAGDDVTLKFRLDQDIDCLDGKSTLTISDDSDGYDERLQTEKTESGFGRGTLLIRQTNYQNDESEVQTYVNILAGIEAGAETAVATLAEGDYEVALDYEVKNDARTTPSIGPIPSFSILPEYNSYTIRFKFSVRNGNAMVFLLDSATGSELTDSAVTENGFMVDFAKSHYLDIYVKRSVLSSNGTDLVDVRSNEPASDGTSYTESGIYTITATNPTTNQTTEKVIYVGNEPLLKCYAITGYSLSEIKTMMDQGATIAEDGSIQWPESPAVAEAGDAAAEEDPSEAKAEKAVTLPIVPIVAVVIVAAGAVAFAKKGGKAAELKAKEVSDEKPKDN
ncbi:hypothetical protein [Paratractidigestivibacter sp.]|uniref:hypothetical protein n=1 Tax=Paratractidigestivibacter sp. TaxID=2847316 RepID=UPI002ABD8CE6|nr:hypothetical protein [Paratractidigestivibacter sp.]